MNAYEISIWRSVKNDGNFTHNASRTEIIHARNKGEAERKILLRKGQVKTLSGEHTFETGDEVIYAVYKIGTVHIEPFYVYSDKRYPKSVSEYKAKQTKLRKEGLIR